MGMKNTYQATIWLDTQHACFAWYEWFWHRGVPAAIIKHKKGFAVYRHLDRHSEDPLYGPSEVIVSCNGFVWNGANK